MKTVSLKLKNGIRINISGGSYAQALRGYIRAVLLVKRAERTARLMERVSKLSSQYLVDWECISQNLKPPEYGSADPCRGQEVPSHVQGQGEASDSGDK